MDSNKNLDQNEINKDEIIDLKNIYLVLLRNKNLMGIFISVGVFIGLIAAVFHKDLWKGNFQIVLEKNNTSSSALLGSLSENSPLNTLIKSGSNELETQVVILKSPSVLMDIFNFVKKEKNLDVYRFRKWSRNLRVNLQDGTSVLDLTYQDYDKDLVLPVLEKISNKYKKYELIKKEKELSTGLKYLTSQIKEYKINSFESFKKVKDYGEKYNLGLRSSVLKPSFRVNNAANNQTQITPNTLVSDVEIQRNKAKEDLRKATEKLNFIKKLNQDSNQIKPIALATFSKNGNELLQDLIKTEKELAKTSQVYLENDKYILFLKNKVKNYKTLIKGELINFYNSEINLYKEILSSTYRPDEVFLKFRKLNQIATKDEITLDTLENQYRFLSLEKARKEDNWDLITEPTLIPYPVGPSKKGKMLISIIASTLAGILFCLAKDKKEDIIYNIEQIKFILKNQNICYLDLKDQETSKENFKIFNISTLKIISESPKFLNIGLIPQQELSKLKEFLKDNLQNESLIIYQRISEALQNESLILTLSLGKTKRKDLIDTLNKFSTYDKKFLGFLVYKC